MVTFHCHQLHGDGHCFDIAYLFLKVDVMKKPFLNLTHSNCSQDKKLFLSYSQKAPAIQNIPIASKYRMELLHIRFRMNNE